MSNKTVANANELQELAGQVNDLLKDVTLQNDFIDMVPSKVDQGEAMSMYHHLNNKLSNVFEVNQRIIKNLDEISQRIYEISDEENSE